MLRNGPASTTMFSDCKVQEGCVNSDGIIIIKVILILPKPDVHTERNFH